MQFIELSSKAEPFTNGLLNIFQGARSYFFKFGLILGKNVRKERSIQNNPHLRI